MDAFVSLLAFTAALFSLCCIIYIGKETVKGLRWLVGRMLYEMEDKENTVL